ncbi:MAG: hypothetical protein RL040_367 [Bacteroidota bacterium]
MALVCYEDVFDNDVATYDNATHYAYDIHGNVKSLLQDNPKLAALLEPLTAPGSAGNGSNDALISHQQRFKRMDYTYDLVSGNVHEVAYQRFEPDQFLHRYHYDADNRIIEVRTSDNGKLWDLDARYHYYDHGPLARVELGEHKVQGIDYAYTLQGWIKGINSDALTPDKDMGGDGGTGLNSYFAKDVVSYSLHYFEGDYQQISSSGAAWRSNTNGSYIAQQRRNLYNGNIGMMLTNLPQPTASNNNASTTGSLGMLGMVYTYDQLNRLVNAEGYMNFDAASNTWGNAASDKLYQNTFTYDANGNIETQKRYGAGNDAAHLIDDLSYLYHAQNDPYTRNRLYAVSENAPATLADDDIEGSATFNAQDPDFTNNYGYTEIGELKHDVKEAIEKIDWRVDSKISYIHRVNTSAKKELKFEYDAMGNRIAKHVYSAVGVYEKTTYYVRDASGNIMATYEFDVSKATFNCTERPIYGSSRLGVYKKTIAFVGYSKRTENNAETGNRQYELSNHLGNVLTTISDRKTFVSGVFVAEVISVTDYSPFGVALEGRSYSSELYRFGFNGKESDTEQTSDINIYSFEFRDYDSRVGRFLSVDPLFATYPWNSTFAFAENRVLDCIDLEGREALSYLASRMFGGVGAIQLEVSTGAGLILAGIKLQGAVGIAYDDKNNFAVMVSYGGFADFFGALGSKLSFGGNPEENGSFELGWTIAQLAASEAYYFGISKVTDLKGPATTTSIQVSAYDFIGISGAGISMNNEVVGVQISTSVGVPGGSPVEAANSVSYTSLAAFNISDISALYDSYEQVSKSIEEQGIKDYKISMTQKSSSEGYTDLIWNVSYKDGNGKTQSQDYNANVRFKDIGDGSGATERVINSN